MSKRPLFTVIAALLCAVPPANAQQRNRISPTDRASRLL
jgi:hypothetical protein